MLRSDVLLDLLITDVGLPGGLNSRQVADAGREVQPVLFITGYAENAAVGNGYLEHGMQVLTKPFAMDALAARVRAIVEAKSRERATPRRRLGRRPCYRAPMDLPRVHASRCPPGNWPSALH